MADNIILGYDLENCTTSIQSPFEYKEVRLFTGENDEDGDPISWDYVAPGVDPTKLKDNEILELTLPNVNPNNLKAMAERIFNIINNVNIKPYNATGTLLNPLAELGDSITLPNYYSGIFKMDETYGELMTTDLSINENEELNKEYEFEDPVTRAITRSIGTVKSSFIVESGKIRAEVQGLQDSVDEEFKTIEGIIYVDDGEGGKKPIDGVLKSVRSSVELLPSSIMSQVSAEYSTKEGTETIASTIKQSIGEIKLSVSQSGEGTQESTITLRIPKDVTGGEEDIVQSATIQFNGIVSFVNDTTSSARTKAVNDSIEEVKKGLSGKTTAPKDWTVIDGGNIITGTLTADQIGTGTLTLGNDKDNGKIIYSRSSRGIDSYIEGYGPELRIYSPGNMSLMSEGNYVSINNLLFPDVAWGPTLPALANSEYGMVFFKI